MTKLVSEICYSCKKNLHPRTTPYKETVGWTDFKIFKGLEIKYCLSCGLGFSTPEFDQSTVNYFYEKVCAIKSFRR